MLLLSPFSLLDGRLRGFRAKQVGDREHANEDHPKGDEERREVAVAGHRGDVRARGSARRRRSHACAGLTRVALLLAISGAGERTQPSASEHHYESCGDSVVLRDSVLRRGRAALGRQTGSPPAPHKLSRMLFRAAGLVVGWLQGPWRGVREKQQGDLRRFGSVRVWWQSPSSAVRSLATAA